MFLDFRRYVLRTVAQNLSNCTQKICKSILLDVRRYVLRAVAQNLSTVSQMHPENMQEQFADSFDVMFCAQ